MNASSNMKKTTVAKTADDPKRIYRAHAKAHDLLMRATSAVKRYGQPLRKPTP